MSVSELLNRANGDNKKFPEFREMGTQLSAKMIAERYGLRVYNNDYEQVFPYKNVQVFDLHYGAFYMMHESDAVTKDSNCEITWNDTDTGCIMLQTDTWVPGDGLPLVAQRIKANGARLLMENIPQEGLRGYGCAMTDGVTVIEERGYTILLPYNQVSLGGDCQSGSWYEGTIVVLGDKVYFNDMAPAQELVRDKWHEYVSEQ